MKPLKIYYLSSEIHPFSNVSSLSKFSRQFSSYLNEDKEIDIRLCQPKYGYISDRKYILREVIRLKDLNINFLNKNHTTNIKSAFIPETRVQIYFMEHEEYFKNVPDLLYKSRNGRFYQNNYEKFLFFVYASFETLKKLFWVPDVIVCNDWQTSLLPIVYKDLYQKDELFKNIKIVSMIHSHDDNYKYPNELFKDFNLSYNSRTRGQDTIKLLNDLADKKYIFKSDEFSKNKLVKSSEYKKMLTSKKSKVFDNFQDFTSSEKVDVFNQIIKDLKSII